VHTNNESGQHLSGHYPYRDRILSAFTILVLGTGLPGPDVAAAADDIGTLRSELDLLKKQVQRLEARLAAAEADTVDTKEAAATSTADASDSEEGIDFGGALRFNYSWKDFDDGARTKRGDAGLDVFRLNVDGRKDNVLLSAEYRFYTYMDTIHHGWLGYDFGESGQIQAGITQVPFGLLPYASHNFWFGIPYYIGLADDYDAGVKYVREGGNWGIQIAAFKNAELGDASNLERYSYDPVAVGPARNEETNTLNARLAYTFEKGGDCSSELGASAQWGQLYNRDTDDTGDHWAAAAHLDSRCGRWNMQLEAGRYEYNPRNPPGVGSESVTFGAFAGAHQIASVGTFGVANVAYNLPVRWPGVDLLTCYNDFSVLSKDDDSYDDSYINTTGCAVGTGPLFTYIDLIQGKNMLFFGDGSLAGDGDNEWRRRFNINMGYYW
jgi:hypothetical protein